MKFFRATTFPLQPYTYQHADGSFGGWENLVRGKTSSLSSCDQYISMQIIDAIAKNLNFKLDISPPPNGELWGEFKNGSFNGLVGQLEKEESDIGWADLFIVPDRFG